MISDFYQLTMAYAYWKAGKTSDQAVFELFFRTNPFDGEYTIFAGLNECITYLQSFKFSEEDVTYLRSAWPCDVDDLDEFFSFLTAIDLTEVTISSVDEGTVVFPRVPLMVVSGPLIACQLLETTLLNLVNFSRCKVYHFLSPFSAYFCDNFLFRLVLN